MKFIAIIISTLSMSFACTAQDTLNVIKESAPIQEIPINPKKRFNPERAALLSAVFPGLGQAYNKKYWKLPIVYGGAVGFYLVYEFNNENYTSSQRAYTKALNDPSLASSRPNLLNQRDFYRRNRDFTIILASAFYAMIITDAYVDAHLKGFDLSENLALSIRPNVDQLAGKTYTSLSFNVYRKK